jgi:hypothetical protein
MPYGTHHTQWWSKIGTQILHMEQCLERAGFGADVEVEEWKGEKMQLSLGIGCNIGYRVFCGNSHTVHTLERLQVLQRAPGAYMSPS